MLNESSSVSLLSPEPETLFHRPPMTLQPVNSPLIKNEHKITAIVFFIVNLRKSIKILILHHKS